MHRSIARLLMLVMLVPVLGPLAPARTSQPMGMHCTRQMQQTPMHPATIHCHGMAMESDSPAPPEPSFSAIDGCCSNHDCCRGMKISEWAQAESAPRSTIEFLVQHVNLSAGTVLCLAGFSEHSPARAPPLFL